jgi:hypothetical protein
MKYFVIRIRTYSTLSPDYTLVKVVDSEENAVSLASILTKCDNDPEIQYIATKQL